MGGGRGSFMAATPGVYVPPSSRGRKLAGRARSLSIARCVTGFAIPWPSMRSGGGKVALAIGARALVAVGVPAFLGRREIEERWWLWRLEAGNAEAKKAAIAKLGEMRSLKALPEFEKVVDSGDRALVEAVLAALPSIGPEAAGVGFRALERAVEGTDSRWTDTVASTLPLLGLTEAVEKASCRPDARQAYGEALERKGRWEDALRQYLWCLDHGAYAPRSSWAINRLGRNSPGALMALRNLRDRLEEMALTSASRRGFLSSLFSRNPTSLVKNLADMNEALDEWDNTLQFFRKLKEIEGGREARRILFWRVLDRLLHDHAYQEIMEAEPELDAVLVDWIWRATNPIAKAWYAAADANQARNWSTSEHFLKRAVAK